MLEQVDLIIGTRDSKLAVWQARTVAGKLAQNGQRTLLRYIKTEGDLVLDTPLHRMGGKGVFTKALDIALLNGRIDMSVNSLKDIPTALPDDLMIGAVLERGDTRDVLVASKGASFLKEKEYPATIATSSIRRQTQWLLRYPNHTMTDIRGNVQTRLRKVAEEKIDGAIFAAAGLNRLGLTDKIDEILDWMVPAPAQGAIAIVIRKKDKRVREAVTVVNHDDTAMCTSLERDFQHRLEAGCSAPVGALAVRENSHIRFKGIVLSPDASEQYQIEMTEKMNDAGDLGSRAAEAVLKQGADHIIRELKQ